MPTRKDELLDKLVVKGGSGTDADVAAVRAQIALLSEDVLAFFNKKKLKVVACRGSVTDVETSLRGKLPRGWDPAAGKTWDDVPGAYLIHRKKIVVGTIAAPGGGRTVPPSGIGHGSCNLALHEALHGHDIASKGRLTATAAFLKARTDDFQRLPDYERQEGRAGIEETFAESGALHYSKDPGFAAARPALSAWWAKGPAETLATAGAKPLKLAAKAVRAEMAAAAEAAVGTATREPDGSILFDLRADEPGVAVGHAAFVQKPAEPGFAEAARALKPPRRGRSLAPAPRTVLVKPVG